jgi:meso-butanediol dehydrogenase/(S,S)-butanediol dehydrogenase/diacetyl reductase
MKLKGKVAIITGAGAGIGEATANLLAKEGAAISCNSLSDSALKVTERINNAGGKALFIKGDVSEEEVAKNIIQRTIDTFGRLDVLFNNAGIVLGGTIDSMTTEDWDKTMDVNVRGVYLVSKYAVPFLKSTHGCIINNASSVAFKGVQNRAAYTASKGAVLALTRAMAADYVQDKIRVNAICPGTTDTPSLVDRIRSRGGDYHQERKAYVERQPLGRLGKPDEIAEGVLFLILNEFCTGTSLLIDGGMVNF